MNQNSNSIFKITRPLSHRIPFVFASPHSGTNYPESFLAESKLDPLTLRCSEDTFVDELFSEAPKYGAPLMKALFPRAYVDPNREAFELDPQMFIEPLPSFVNSTSPRVNAGLGTVPRLVTSGNNIYRNKISFKEAKNRINKFYFPYHRALKRLIDETKNKFGKCILIDCHSMPSIQHLNTLKGVDVILGNKHGKTCAHELILFVENHLKTLSLNVHTNYPYAGGYTTEHYGNPKNNIHSLQIEIARSLYMDEQKLTKNNNFKLIKKKLSNLLGLLANAQFSF